MGGRKALAVSKQQLKSMIPLNRENRIRDESLEKNIRNGYTVGEHARREHNYNIC